MNSLIDFEFGELPIIIVSSHGGNLNPDFIKDRTNGNITPDLYTLEFSQELLKQIESIYHKKPYKLFCKLSRKKLDLNRSFNSGSCCNEGKKIWKEWYKILDSMIEDINKKFNYGIILDIHGHGGNDNRIWLGYGIKKEDLIDNRFDNSSLSKFINKSYFSKQQIISGDKSLGHLINQLSNDKIDCIPSLIKINNNDRYLSGGFLLKTYGINKIDCIQIELPLSLRLNREYICLILSKSLKIFLII